MHPRHRRDERHGHVTWLTIAQGTQKRTQQQLELEIENMGGHLNAYTSVCAAGARCPRAWHAC